MRQPWPRLGTSLLRGSEMALITHRPVPRQPLMKAPSTMQQFLQLSPAAMRKRSVRLPFVALRQHVLLGMDGYCVVRRRERSNSAAR